MKITIYELLGMVKDGKAPNKIKYDNIIFEYDGDFYSSKTSVILDEYCNLTVSLNDEVEILEEEKKIPEKLPSICACSDFNENEEKLAKNINILKNKYNEIIDYLDYLKSKGE